MPSTVVVSGLAQIQRDLAKSGPAVSKAMREGMREAAAPVAELAKDFSLSRIRRMKRSPQLANTRTGVTQKAVYIVPKERGVRPGGMDSRRRGGSIKGGGLLSLMGRTFDDALDAGAPIVVGRVSHLLGKVIHG